MNGTVAVAYSVSCVGVKVHAEPSVSVVTISVTNVCLGLKNLMCEELDECTSEDCPGTSADENWASSVPIIKYQP